MGRRGKIITEYEELLICKQYTENWSLRKIAAYANVSQTTVLAILRRRDIPLRQGKRITPSQKAHVVELYNAGMNIASIIDNTGVKSEQTIYRILRDANIEIRKAAR